MLYEDAVKDIISKLKAEHKNITAALAITLEGTPITSLDMPEAVHLDTLAIMAATMFGAAATVNSELKIGLPFEAVAKSRNGEVTVVPVNSKALLVVITSGPLTFELSKAISNAAEKIKSVVT